MRVPVSKRARFVGPGGYNLRRLQAQTGAMEPSTNLLFIQSGMEYIVETGDLFLFF